MPQRKNYPQSRKAVDKICERLRQGGTHFFMSARTSGRLAVLDKLVNVRLLLAFLPHWYKSHIIAGGHDAMLRR